MYRTVFEVVSRYVGKNLSYILPNPRASAPGVLPFVGFLLLDTVLDIYPVYALYLCENENDFHFHTRGE